MDKIGIFYGSTTGNTETIAEKIQEKMGGEQVDIYDIDGVTIETVNQYSNIVFAIPTWDIGQLQEDWEDWIDNLDSDEFAIENKKFAFFGVGDQEGYPDTFGDAIGIIYNKLKEKKASLVIDQWPIESYTFDESVALQNGYFIGMMIDEDNQPELTDERVDQWVAEAKKVFQS